MLCVEDYIDALHWSDAVGGLQGLIKRSEVRTFRDDEHCKSGKENISDFFNTHLRDQLDM